MKADGLTVYFIAGVMFDNDMSIEQMVSERIKKFS